MSTTTLSTGPSNPVDERQPLLGSHPANAYVQVPPDPEAAVSADGPDETQIVLKKKVDFWSVLWYLAFVTFGGIILAGIIKGIVENGDVDVCVVVPTCNCQSFGRSPLSYITAVRL